MENSLPDRIAELQEKINELRREAEELKKSNPNHAVTNARRACEAICFSICQSKELFDKNESSSRTLSNMIYLISGKKDLVPRHILEDIRFIQKKGNAIIHSYEQFNPEDAEPVLNALANLINWYFSGSTATKTCAAEAEAETTETQTPNEDIDEPIRPVEKTQDDFIGAARRTFKKSWFQTAAVTVMAATATALAAKGLKGSDDEEE